MDKKTSKDFDSEISMQMQKLLHSKPTKEFRKAYNKYLFANKKLMNNMKLARMIKLVAYSRFLKTGIISFETAEDEVAQFMVRHNIG